MNRLLPAPKSIEMIGDTFKPDGWQYPFASRKK